LQQAECLRQRPRLHSDRTQANATNALLIGSADCPADQSAIPPASLSGELVMLHYAIVFLVIALIAGLLGFSGIAGSAVGIAKLLFLVFIVLAGVSLLLGKRGNR